TEQLETFDPFFKALITEEQDPETLSTTTDSDMKQHMPTIETDSNSFDLPDPNLLVPPKDTPAATVSPVDILTIRIPGQFATCPNSAVELDSAVARGTSGEDADLTFPPPSSFADSKPQRPFLDLDILQSLPEEEEDNESVYFDSPDIPSWWTESFE